MSTPSASLLFIGIVTTRETGVSKITINNLAVMRVPGAIQLYGAGYDRCKTFSELLGQASEISS
jgi:hypothetical protein